VLLEDELVALARGALGVEVQQFGGGVVHLLGSFLLGLFPLPRAQGVQLDRFRVGTAVARDDLQLGHRHVELGAVGIFEVQEFGVAFAEVHVQKPEVAADAVAFMHHGIADPQFGEVAQPAVEVGAAGIGAASPWTRGGGVEFVLRDDRDAFQQEAARQGADAEHEAGFICEESGEIERGRGGEAVFGEIVGQGLAPAGRFGQQQDTAGLSAEEGAQGSQRVVGLAIDGERRQDRCAREAFEPFGLSLSKPFDRLRANGYRSLAGMWQ
jgi:hypothetical protein